MQISEIGGDVSLKGVTSDQQTFPLFNAAGRSGEKDVLSSLDAISYVMYLDAYERCGSASDSSFPAERCRQVVSRGDMRGQPFSEAEIRRKLSEYPEDRQRELIRRAGAFMQDARALIQKKGGTR